MRPALLRLLKRPSAISVLGTLAATPTGIEQLESRYARLRCQSRCAHQNAPNEDDARNGSTAQDLDTKPQIADDRRSFNFTIYDIEPPEEERTPSSTSLTTGLREKSTPKLLTKSLRFQPERLEFESDIGHNKDIGTRLVDRPENRNDFELWEELLKFRQRRYGDKGTQDIWEGLTVRLDGVRLPVTGEQADFFWQSFMKLGLRRELFLKEVVEYALDLHKHEGESWPQLYESVVGGLLDRGYTKRAIRWNKIFQQSGLASPNDVLQVLRPVIRPSSLVDRAYELHLKNAERPSSLLRTFRLLCRSAEGHQIYGPVMSTLLQHGYGEGAISIHKFLVARNDHPRTRSEIQPLLDYARMYGFADENHTLQAYARGRFGTEAKKAYQGAVGNAPDGTPDGKPFKDDIGARLFATRALNFDMVLGGLKILGVSAIGPRSLRELAVRAHGSQDILEKLKMLRQSGISIGDSLFARLVQKLAAQSRDILLSDLLSSDQHPDVLEDKKTQESLLVSYYTARDSRQYNVSLAVLAELYPDDPDLLDIHFRKHIAAGDLKAAAKIVDEMTLRGQPLTEDSMDFMAEKVLTPRRPAHLPQLSPGKRLNTKREVMFILRVLQRSVPLGGYVSPAFWQELLKRLGMEDYWSELRECCLWLVRQYATRSKDLWPTAPSKAPTGSLQDDRMLKLIFAPEMQTAVVAWGFKDVVNRATASQKVCLHPTTSEPLIPWVRGLLLLGELEQAGLFLHTRVIRDATRTRLAILYGRFCLSRSPRNRTLRRVNPYRWQQVVRDILCAWGDPSFFGGQEETNPTRLMNPYRTPGSRRRSARTVWPRKRQR
ncbi:uncharacterized protein N7482_004587 [Penicillium canariense]|uniref:Uncharacterized protein n=1 Tax=Penicillium canariense TaxID=189055 RepID=A0A9W9I909_9EURO|nr:uncharacterized protein N7482_004587 [Penicillium canariense]KAJ5168993.1 hypothetical protein N7482_004587 [Penicillium canariense]